MTKNRKKPNDRWNDIDGKCAFVIPLTLLGHPNFTRLSPHGCKLLLDLGRQYKGFNNGDLCATFSVMASRGWRSETTLREAIAECEHYGLIARSRQGGRNRCNLFALTWRRLDKVTGKRLDMIPTLSSSNDWKKEVPPFVAAKRKRNGIDRPGGNLRPPAVQ